MKVHPENSENKLPKNLISYLKGGRQGGRQGDRLQNLLQNPCNDIINNNLATSEVWLSTSEGSRLVGMRKQSFRENIKKNKYVTKWHTGNGGKQYRILLSSLPIEAQLKYWNEQGIDFNNIINNEIPEEKIDEADIVRIAYENASEFNRKKFDKYRLILNDSEFLTGKELEDFVEKWNNENPENTTSARTISKKRKIVKEMGLVGLLGNYGKNTGISKIDDYHFEYFSKMYLDEERQTAEACWMATLGYAKQLDTELKVEEFPSVSSFVRRLEAEVPKDVIDLKRRGYAYWNKHWNNYVDRDYTNIQPGEVWVSDHRQIDQAVLNELDQRKRGESLKEWFNHNLHAFQTDGRNKKPVFPWLTVWRDFLTGKWLGWFIHIEEPNTDHVLHAFQLAASSYGVPRSIIIDNGKDYRSKDFAGGRVKKYKLEVHQTKVRSLCSLLNIDVTFTIPYNAQAKPIERDFKIYKEWMDKKFPGYRGGNVIERPEKLAGEIKTGKIISIGKYIPFMNFFVDNILHKYKSNGKVLQGRSRDEAWHEEIAKLSEAGTPRVVRRVTDDDLKLFCMRMSKDQKIVRNGICLSQTHNLYYWGEWMHGIKGEYVYMRRDNSKYQEAWVFRSKDNTFIGKAYLNAFTAPAYARTDLEKKQLQDVIQKKNVGLKIAKALGKSDLQISAEEELRHHAMGIKALNGDDDIKIPASKEVVTYYKSEISEANAKEKLRRTGTDDVENYGPLTKKEEEVKSWIGDE
ncbi:MAG: DDE-type integrase/transposase/recombinase [Ignavibacteriae bacterium]|nr:hypothetical protein [Ignavibacteriota bacterium]NOG97053.1 DDE-type integrase/transposase/recombinase [Ignavibacteriota bacterium]